MSRPVQSADLYTDFSGFARLRAEAREGSREGARGAAEQMEAVLLGMMIKSMRSGAGAGLTGTEAGTQQSMYDSQMAQNLAKSGKLGFARMMLAELVPGADPAPGAGVDAATATRSAAGYPAPARSRLLDVHPVAAPVPAATRVAAGVAPQPGDHHPGARARAAAGASVVNGPGADIAPPPPASTSANGWSPTSHPYADAVADLAPEPVAAAGVDRWPAGHHPDSDGDAVAGLGAVPGRRADHHPGVADLPPARIAQAPRLAAVGGGDRHPPLAPLAVADAPAMAAAGQPAAWTDADEFARDLWPAAARAAQELGTEPEAVLAVAALETGWGKHMPRTSNGEPSFNLFGIKAHRRATNWQGTVTHAPTLEFENGAFTRKLEPFRTYDSPDAAFQDFVAFIKAQPRYSEALDQAADPVAFVHALHKAGYATDPRYGSKLESLMRGGVLGRARLAAADAATMVS